MAIVDSYSKSTADTAVLDSLKAAASDAGLPITWETLKQGVETNASWIGNTIQDLGAKVINDKGADVVNVALASSRDAEMTAFTNRVFDSITSQYNDANGTNYLVNSNVTFTPPSNPNAGHDNPTYNATWDQPTTTTITVPAQYETVTSTVPVTTSVTKYRTVQDVTYTEERSSSSSSSMIPYMRSVYLAYKGNGYKPNSTYNAYFDGVDVSGYVTPATELIVQVASSSIRFDTSTDVGSGVTVSARSISGNPINTLSIGDIITDSTSGATAVLVGSELSPTVSSIQYLKLFVVNVIGTFSIAHTITGSISGSTGTISSIKNGVSGTITSSPYGNLYGLYHVPNDSVSKFTTGVKKFLFSTGTASDTQADSWGSVNFTAQGTLNTIQPVVTTIRHVSDRQEAYTTTETTYQTVSEQVLVRDAYVQTVSGLTTVASVHQMPHVEPLAQSFYVHEETGVYLTGLDLFFASKDDTLPVYVSIIDLQNGYPGTNEIDLSKTTIPAYDVKLSTSTSVDANGNTWASADTPTRITFKAPVFLEGLKDYCIFIKSDSFKYRVWTSYMKDPTVNGLGTVASQPSMGTLFKSQNATTWSADQNQDLTYKLYRAKFNTAVNPNVQFRNSPLKPKSVPYGAIQTYAGISKVRVYLMNHGFSTGSIVSLAGITSSANDISAGSIVAGRTYVIKTFGSTNWSAIGASTVTIGAKFVATANGSGTGTASEAPYYGLTSTELTGQFTVVDADLDSFTFAVATAPLFTGTIVDPTLTISRNIRFDNVQTIIQELKPVGTNIQYTYQARSNYTPAIYSTLATLPNNRSVDTTDTLLVMTPDNESTNGASFKLNAVLSSTSDWLSPMIDTHRLSLVTTGNRIDTPSTSYNVANIDFDTIVTGSSLFTINSTNNSFNTSDTATKLIVSKFVIGSYVNVTGCTNAANNGAFKITSVASDGAYFIVESTLITETPSALNMYWGRRYKAETTPSNSSSISKYISKQLKFANKSTSFKLFFIYNKPSAADIKFYYKISNSSDNSIHQNLPYVYAPFDSSLISSETKGDLSEGSIHIEGLTQFDTLSIKIVYNSSNTNKIPRIRDFRIVALA